MVSIAWILVEVVEVGDWAADRTERKVSISSSTAAAALRFSSVERG